VWPPPKFILLILLLQSWPMHHANVSTNYPWLPHNLDPSLPVPIEYKDMQLQPLGNVHERHTNYMQSCFDYYQKIRGKGSSCYETERDRIAMTLRQPQSMRNYTRTGFLKIRAPDHVFQSLKTFWDKNRHEKKPEEWTTGNIYT
jgi:prolyl 4-hydroxylase